jgi:S1-C subfamily serine protease
VLLFGHSRQLDKHGQLTPLAIQTTVSGWNTHGEGRLWQVKQNEVLPGMSGGPALDLSTGQVIGLTTATIGEGSDRGGYIVPIDSLISLADTELGGRLLAAGVEYHAEYPR